MRRERGTWTQSMARMVFHLGARKKMIIVMDGLWHLYSGQCEADDGFEDSPRHNGMGIGKTTCLGNARATRREIVNATAIRYRSWFYYAIWSLECMFPLNTHCMMYVYKSYISSILSYHTISWMYSSGIYLEYIIYSEPALKLELEQELLSKM